jgi:glucose/arabinose dehydrogenase
MRIAAMLVAVLLLAGCTTTVSPGSSPPSGVQPVGEPEQIVDGLEAPWSMVRLESGSTLISERDSGTVVELMADGDLREVGRVADTVHESEGGLLGLEVVGESLYAYVTTDDDNRIERFDLVGDAASYSLGDSEAILTGIRKAGNHNGGRIKVGPDGMLYATVGDAGDPDAAQDPDSLNGKILRMELDGGVPADNPFDGSLVYSLGHRNPQGLAWDAEGQLWAAEFGQDTWDEFNRIEAGSNYGWPVVEGMSDDRDFVNPEYQWPTDDASPSGLAFVDGAFFLAALRGARLWVLYPDREAGVDAVAWFTGEYGRIRDVVPGPDGSLWMLTNNTDGRGSPQQGDDRILQVALSELVEG